LLRIPRKERYPISNTITCVKRLTGSAGRYQNESLRSRRNTLNKKPRDYADEIGESMRTYFKEQIKDVPPEYREMVTDYVINGMKIGRAKAKK
jgi:hypothetical protein